MCWCRRILHDDDDKFTPTEHLTPPPHHSSSRPAAAHTETEPPLLHQQKREGPVDRPPQPIWPIVGPPKLAPEGGPGPGGQSKGTWTLVLARPHGVEPQTRACSFTKDIPDFIGLTLYSRNNPACQVLSLSKAFLIFSHRCFEMCPRQREQECRTVAAARHPSRLVFSKYPNISSIVFTKGLLISSYRRLEMCFGQREQECGEVAAARHPSRLPLSK